MSASYTSNPAGVPRDHVRALIGDTGRTAAGGFPSFLLQDEEIAGALSLHGGPLSAAAFLADVLAAMFARDVDGGTEGITTRSSQAFDHYTKLAVTLRARAVEAGEPGAVRPGETATIAGPVATGLDDRCHERERRRGRYGYGYGDCEPFWSDLPRC